MFDTHQLQNDDESQMPDVASSHSIEASPSIDWVGMDGIAVPLVFGSDDLSGTVGKVNAYVNLNKDNAKGIHMSRLFLLVQERLASQSLTYELISQLLEDMVTSQGDISQAAKLQISCEIPVLKKALFSDNQGYQSFPITLTAMRSRDGIVQIDLDLTVTYSSTCPCSAALSRQLLARKLDKVFDEDKVNKADLLAWIASEEGSVATPHSQRSFSYISLSYKQGEFPNIVSLIQETEAVFATYVQTAVKREDEQEFARLNGQNLMFCEDAARRMIEALEARSELSDYHFKIEHQESLHAHNAVAEHRKA